MRGNLVTARSGKCAWRICYATQTMPSRKAATASRWSSNGCCCAPSPSAAAAPASRTAPLRQYHADLERRLDRLLRRQPDKPASRRPFKAMRRDRDDLFRFVTRRDVPYTNNACERALRPSVIFRKVTGCFRSKWGAKVYAAAASVIATGRLHGFTALQAVSNALAGKPVMIPP